MSHTSSTAVGPFSCSLCSVQLASLELLDVHNKGKKHLKQEKSLLQLKEKHPHAEADSAGFVCTICSVRLNSLELLETHEKGKKHLKREKAISEEKQEPPKEAAPSTVPAEPTPKVNSQPTAKERRKLLRQTQMQKDAMPQNINAKGRQAPAANTNAKAAVPRNGKHGEANKQPATGFVALSAAARRV